MSPAPHSPSAPQWIQTRPVPLDFGGPTEVPFDADAVRLLEEQGGVAAVEAAARLYPD